MNTRGRARGGFSLLEILVGLGLTVIAGVAFAKIAHQQTQAFAKIVEQRIESSSHVRLRTELTNFWAMARRPVWLGDDSWMELSLQEEGEVEGTVRSLELFGWNNEVIFEYYQTRSGGIWKSTRSSGRFDGRLLLVGRSQSSLQLNLRHEFLGDRFCTLR